jgi:hypothetical protein
MESESDVIFDDWANEPPNLRIGQPSVTKGLKGEERTAKRPRPGLSKPSLEGKHPHAQGTDEGRPFGKSMIEDRQCSQPIAVNLNELKCMFNKANSVSDYSFSQDFESGSEPNDDVAKSEHADPTSYRVQFVSSPNHGNPPSLRRIADHKLLSTQVCPQSTAAEDPPGQPSQPPSQTPTLQPHPKESVPRLKGQPASQKGASPPPSQPANPLRVATLSELLAEKKQLTADLKSQNEDISRLVEEQGYRNVLSKLRDNRTDFKSRPAEVKCNTYQREMANNEKVIATLLAEKAQCEQTISRINSPEYLALVAEEVAEQKRLAKTLKTEIHAQALENKRVAKTFSESRHDERQASEFNLMLKEAETFNRKNADLRNQIDKLAVVYAELVARRHKQKDQEGAMKDMSEDLHLVDGEATRALRALVASRDKWSKHVGLIEHNVCQKCEFLEREVESLHAKESGLQEKLECLEQVVERQGLLVMRRTDKQCSLDELLAQEVEIERMVSEVEFQFRVCRPTNFRGQPQRVRSKALAEGRVSSGIEGQRQLDKDRKPSFPKTQVKTIVSCNGQNNAKPSDCSKGFDSKGTRGGGEHLKGVHNGGVDRQSLPPIKNSKAKQQPKEVEKAPEGKENTGSKLNTRLRLFGMKGVGVVDKAVEGRGQGFMQEQVSQGEVHAGSGNEGTREADWQAVGGKPVGGLPMPKAVEDFDDCLLPTKFQKRRTSLGGLRTFQWRRMWTQGWQ